MGDRLFGLELVPVLALTLGPMVAAGVISFATGRVRWGFAAIVLIAVCFVVFAVAEAGPNEEIPRWMKGMFITVLLSPSVAFGAVGAIAGARLRRGGRAVHR